MIPSLLVFTTRGRLERKKPLKLLFFLQTVVISDSFQHDIYANVGDSEFISSRGTISKRTL